MLLVDGGYGDNHASTVIRFNDRCYPEVIREGKGECRYFLISLLQ